MLFLQQHTRPKKNELPTFDYLPIPIRAQTDRYYTQIQLYSLKKNKNCACLGESGSDIINEISKYASKCAIAIRGKHGHLIPRIQGNGRVTDLNTNRCRYSNPYVFGDWIGYVNQMAKKVLSTFAPDSDQKKV